MQKTAKDYFVERVETQQREEKNARKTIILNTIIGIASLASSAYISGTEEYPFDSIIMERLCPIFGVVGAVVCYTEIMDALKSKASQTRETKTPEEKAKVYTRNLQREISFSNPSSR